MQNDVQEPMMYVFTHQTHVSSSVVIWIFFFKDIFMGFFGQYRADRKTLGEESGVGSANDLEMGIELGSPRAQLR